ncbi:hypothetical protein EX30DRAFT_355516 [Ascodesmis nigricans]|uniref:WD40 repeat-like protein n=1 Tax=Ascodesmis nigricans TaxID=341454 RepID=A0A4S2MTI7_9PEZI|nr:hypothetical protein EX30DRAFT_355516 [Ascodesmis nigricans]
MEFSAVYRASNGSLPSPNGSLIASIVPPRLEIRSAATLQITRVVNLNPTFASKVQFMRWSPLPQSNVIKIGLVSKRRSGIDNSEEEGTFKQRLLLADDESIQVLDVDDDKWSASIKHGFEGIKNVDFGRSCEEVIIFSDFQTKLTVWNLQARDGRRIEIPNPKFATKGYDYRPCTSHFALLSRSATQDIVSIHQNTTYRVSHCIVLPTLDAQGLRWSPCGRWLAVWESPVSSYKVLVYTADGHLYRTHQNPECDGLGVKTVEWSPIGDFLTVGGHDGKLCFLNNYTFSPVISMNHTRTVRLPGVTVWSENVLGTRERYYRQVAQPATIPTAASNATDVATKTGISAMAYSNPDGTLVATRNDSMPETVWIWSLKLLRPYAVLTHRNPVKTMSWHPTIPELLMIQCSLEPTVGNVGDKGNCVYIWCSSWKEPRAVQVPMERISGSIWAKWIHTTAPAQCSSSSTVSTSPQPFVSTVDRRSNSPEKDASEKRPMILLGDKEGFVVGYVEDEPIPDAAWSPIDWTAYSPSQAPGQQRPASYFTSDNINSSKSDKLASVDEQPSGSNERREDDGSIEFRLWKRGY